MDNNHGTTHLGALQEANHKRIDDNGDGLPFVLFDGQQWQTIQLEERQSDLQCRATTDSKCRPGI